jgi:hypothetical protein
MHVVSIGHATDAALEPNGIEIDAVQVVRLAVLYETTPPPWRRAIATQEDVPEHEIAEKRFTNGWSRIVQVVLPVSPIIDGLFETSPMPTHVIALGHATAVSASVLFGGVCETHVLPSIVCTMATPPTAVHSSIVKQEID